MEKDNHCKNDRNGQEKMVVGPKIQSRKKANGDEMPQSENRGGKSPSRK